MVWSASVVVVPRLGGHPGPMSPRGGPPVWEYAYEGSLLTLPFNDVIRDVFNDVAPRSWPFHFLFLFFCSFWFGQVGGLCINKWLGVKMVQVGEMSCSAPWFRGLNFDVFGRRTTSGGRMVNMVNG